MSDLISKIREKQLSFKKETEKMVLDDIKRYHDECCEWLDTLKDTSIITFGTNDKGGIAMYKFIDYKICHNLNSGAYGQWNWLRYYKYFTKKIFRKQGSNEIIVDDECIITFNESVINKLYNNYIKNSNYDKYIPPSVGCDIKFDSLFNLKHNIIDNAIFDEIYEEMHEHNRYCELKLDALHKNIIKHVTFKL